MRRRGGQRLAVNTNRPAAAATYDVRRDLVSALHARCFSRMRLNMKQASIPDSRFRCSAPVALWWTYPRECRSPCATATATATHGRRETNLHLRGTGTARRIGAILCLGVGEAGKAGGGSVAHNPLVRNGLPHGFLSHVLADTFEQCLV